MKVFNGWVLMVEGQEQTVIGSLKIRGNQSYILKNVHGDKTSISRDALLSYMHSKSIEYVRSVAI